MPFDYWINTLGFRQGFAPGSMKRRRNGFQSTLGTRRAFKRPRRTRPVMAGARFRGRRGLNVRTGGFQGIELKFYDTSLIAAALVAPTDATGAEVDPSATIVLNSVIQADGEENRDGRQITMKKISVRGVITCPSQTNQTVPETSTVVYIALVLDKQTNKATINSEDVFKNEGGNSATAASPFRNLQNIKRFSILKTVTLILPQVQSVWDGTNFEQYGSTTPFEIHKDLNLSVNYAGTTETVLNITDNSLHLIAFCNDVSMVPNISYNARLRFVG